jgi:hypothetical protein
MVDYVLRNEKYIGKTAYNRESSPLRGKATKNPPDLWIRNKGAMPAVIDRSVFHRAQRRMKLRWEHLSDDELLSRLKSLLEKEGRLSQAIMNRTLGMPCVARPDKMTRRYLERHSAPKLIVANFLLGDSVALSDPCSPVIDARQHFGGRE